MSEVFVTAQEAIARIAAGQMIVVTDDESRENEGDVVIAAEFATPQHVNFMARHARGLVCLPLEGARCDELELPPQPRRGQSEFDTAFTVSIGVRDGVTTGGSAHDRARTIRAAIDPRTGPADLVRPGHVFPLRARPGGVLERAGHTEAAVDLPRLAGLRPAGVICEVLKDDGTMARVPDLKVFCREHGLSIVTIEEIAAHRRRTEVLVERVASARLPTEHGEFTIVGYRHELTGQEHVALVRGRPEGRTDVLARVHSQCLTGDAFGSSRCDCGGQLQDAMRRIAVEGTGVLVHLAQEGRGVGLVEKVRAYALQDEHGPDAVDANIGLGHEVDLRDFGVGAQILRDLGVRDVRLMTNDPQKAAALEVHGIRIAARVPLEQRPTRDDVAYLDAKPQPADVPLAATVEAQQDLSWLPAVDTAV